MKTQAALKKLFNTISQAAIARELNITPSAVSQWTINGIPANRVIHLEQLTGGQVTRHEMRPDLYPVE